MFLHSLNWIGVKLRHEINTGESSPICQPPRRVPFSHRPTIRRLVDDMLKTKVVLRAKEPLE